MLFNKEKDWILKITNLILVIWLVAAICFFQANIIEVIFNNEKMSYEKYEKYYCYNYNPKGEEIDTCRTFYNDHLRYAEDEEIREKKGILLSFGNIIIVSTGIYFLNNERRKK